jgi:hypothetical protein
MFGVWIDKRALRSICYARRVAQVPIQVVQETSLL